MKNPFKNIRVSYRLLLISVSFSLPIAVLLIQMVIGVNANIRFALWETYGNEYQRPLMDLLHAVPQHEFAAQTGDKVLLTDTAGKVDQAFSSLETIQAKLGESLGFTPAELAKRQRDHVQPGNVKKEWTDLKSQITQLSEDAVREKHTHLVADIRTMITHAGDLSNLILDPDLDSYYLMDATLCALPQLQDRLAATMALGVDALSRTNLSKEERIQFSVAAAMLTESDLGRTQGSLDTSLSEDPNFHGVSPSLAVTIRPKAVELSAAAEAFIALTHRIASEETASVTTADYLAAGHRARAAAQSLWAAAVTELDTLLERRMGSFKSQRAWQIGWTALALGLSLTLVFFIAISLTGPLRALIISLDQNAGHVGHAVTGWAESSQSLADGASQQAAALEETSASLEEMSSMTKRTAENAQTAKEVANQTRQAAETGAAEMNSMSQAMGEIKSSSDNIAKIIKTIDEIAFQTNLLALNAAVEAARAGEAGMGLPSWRMKSAVLPNAAPSRPGKLPRRSRTRF